MAAATEGNVHRIAFSRSLRNTLRCREAEVTGESLGSETGQPVYQTGDGDLVAGTYRRRIALDPGWFAVTDDGLGFQFVPWRLSLERPLGRHMFGVSLGIDWKLGRKCGLGL